MIGNLGRAKCCFRLYNFFLGNQLAVGLHDIQKGLDPGFQPGIRRMAVQLQCQGRFAAHNLPEISDHKRIRSAGEVGDISAEQLGVAFDQPTGFNHQFSHPPVHVTLGTLIHKIEKIQRHHQNASGCKFVRNSHMGFIGVSVVGAREENHRKLLRVGL